jgi:hypothetical protein
MDSIVETPQWILDSVPDGVKDFLNGGGWPAFLILLTLVGSFVLLRLISKGISFFSRKSKSPPELKKTENLAAYPPLPPSTGDRRLLVEGVPVRLRLIVIAPAGRESALPADPIFAFLDQVVPGLGGIAKSDQTKVVRWPRQLSDDGFAHQFHRFTPAPEGEKNPTIWVLVAGRVKSVGQSIMLGLGMQAIKPTTIGRRNLKPHEWPIILRIRVRDEFK